VVKTRLKIVGEEREKENRMATREGLRRTLNIIKVGLDCTRDFSFLFYLL